MSDWTSGYVADIGYTYGCFSELNPLQAKLAFLNAGLVSPEIGTACELGFGQGLSVNIHAAASVTAWCGTDFNPAQAGFARELARASGADARLFDESFIDFANRADLPNFDYIGLHGIWSWISDANREVIVDFVRRKLKVGGILYVSYNTQPGWAGMVPFRDLLTEHSGTMGALGQGIASRIDAALDFADKLLATKPSYVRSNPEVVERLKAIKEKDRNYLAHEYFNRDWHPMSFARMAKWMSAAKLNYACSAYYLDHLDLLNLTAEQQALLNAIPDPLFRETVRDFMVNQMFRRDYWIKGARTLSPLEKIEALRAHRVVLVQHRADVSLKVTGSLGEVGMQAAVYNPILNVLANHQPQTLGEVEQAVKAQGVNFAQVIHAMMVLTSSGALQTVQDGDVTSKAKKQTDKLNTFLLNKVRGSGEVGFLASPLSGSGLSVDRFQQLFLLAETNGMKGPAEMAQYVWSILSGQGRTIIKDGKELLTAEENLAELTVRAKTFSEKKLPVLKALLIA